MLRTVLIVEDTETGLETLELALARLPGVALRPVKSAEEALESLTDDICALVTDLNLPQMDGFELIEAVRAHPSRGLVPILVISGDSDPGTASRLTALGANAYFPKPFSPTEVRNRLEQLIDVS